MNNTLNNLKFSFIGEILTRLMTPLANVLLARLLLPEDFGILSIIIMIVTFLDLFSDSGLQKYIIQKKFETLESEKEYINTIFTLNLLISIIISIGLLYFSKPIMSMLNINNKYPILEIAAFVVILTSFSGIQTSILKKRNLFNKLMYIRIIGAFIPFLITVPLAYYSYGPLALLLGYLTNYIYLSIISTYYTKWLFKLTLKSIIIIEIYKYGIYSLMESFLIWLTLWFDTLIINKVFTLYQIGLFRNTQVMTNAIFGIISSSIIPVFFSKISQIKDDEDITNNFFYKIQKYLSIVAIPIGIGVFSLKEFLIVLIFGENWIEASDILGYLALSTSLNVAYSSLSSELYRAYGKVNISFVVQFIYLLILIPFCYLASKIDFIFFIKIRSLLKIIYIFINFYILQKYFNISIKKILQNTLPTLIASIS
ncbi:MAG: oligosaccharide flippase family protein, partial [Cetobacterium sp.]|uniref:oligosaccharide flippase family protein n=1 Tax=Cetobacterium sp. TaxID=2071632 RepID=UPI003EE45FC2